MATEKHRIKLGETDLGSLLGDLGDRIRRDALAVTCIAQRHTSTDSQQYRDMMALAVSLEGSAAVLAGIESRLCRACALQRVVEVVEVGDGVEARDGGGDGHSGGAE